MRDLFPPKERKPRPRVVRTTEHEVRDAAGELQAMHVRLDYSDGSKSLPLAPAGRRRLRPGGRPVETLPLYGSELVTDWPTDARRGHRGR